MENQQNYNPYDPNSTIKLGSEIEYKGIQRYKAVEKGSEVISIISSEMKVLDLHYHPKTGYVYFNQEQKTSELLGKPTSKIIIPIIRYDGNPKDYGSPVKVYYLGLGISTYKSQIMTKIEAGYDLLNCDLIINCRNAEKQTDLSLTKIEGKQNALWKDDKAMVEYVEKSMSGFWSLLLSTINIKHLTHEQIVTYIQSDNGNSSYNKNISEKKPGQLPY